MKKLLLLFLYSSLFVPICCVSQSTFKKANDYLELAKDHEKQVIDDYSGIGFEEQKERIRKDREQSWKAVEYYTKAIDIDPGFVEAYVGRAFNYDFLLAGINPSNEADELRKLLLSDYLSLHKYDPDEVLWPCRIGVTFMAYGRVESKWYKSSIKYFDIAVEIDPNYANAYMFRANAKKLLGIEYCSDYKKCCDLGNSIGCLIYKKCQ